MGSWADPPPSPSREGRAQDRGAGSGGVRPPSAGAQRGAHLPEALALRRWTLKAPGTRLTQEHGARRRRRDRTILLQVCASLPRGLTSVPPTRACCARPSAGLAVAHRVGPALIPKAVDQQAERKVPPGRLSLLFPRMCHAVQENSSVWLTRRRRRIAAHGTRVQDTRPRAAGHPASPSPSLPRTGPPLHLTL